MERMGKALFNVAGGVDPLAGMYFPFEIRLLCEGNKRREGGLRDRCE